MVQVCDAPSEGKDHAVYAFHLGEIDLLYIISRLMIVAVYAGEVKDDRYAMLAIVEMV